MRRTITLLGSVLLSIGTLFAQETPLSMNGKLRVDGIQLVNECGKPIQLRGMSSHGIQWFQNCFGLDAIEVLKKDWGTDLVRIALYTTQKSNGYIGREREFKDLIDAYVEETEKMGLYLMIDWHILEDYDPNINIEAAKEFWGYMSKKHSGKKHVLYEICNEPNKNPATNQNVSWSRIKEYANVIIPIIRANDPSTIIIVGTPEWSGQPKKVIFEGGALTQYTNIMYAFHFYAGTHTYLMNDLKEAANFIPIFATEWGTVNADGGGSVNETNTNSFMSIMNGGSDNKQLISWANWSYSDKNEGSAALIPGSCNSGNWNNTTVSGTLVKKLMSSPDNFTKCVTGLEENEISAGDLNLYPNPASDKLILSSSKFNLAGKNMEIYNSLGLKVMEGTALSNNTELDVKNLSPGVYTLKISKGRSELFLKWIKN